MSDALVAESAATAGRARDAIALEGTRESDDAVAAAGQLADTTKARAITLVECARLLQKRRYMR